MRIAPYTACLIALAVATLANAQEPVQLQLNLEPGQTYRHRMESNQTITQTLMGMEQENVQSIRFTYAFDVASVDEAGVAIATLTYEHVAASMSAGPIKAEYDSNEPDASTLPPMMDPYKELAGSKYTVTIGPDGLIDHVEGVEGEAPSDEAAAQVRALFEQTFAIYPEEPVKPGDTWSRTVETTSIMPMNVANTWTLKDLGATEATIALQSDITPDPEAGPVQMQGMELTFDFTGQQSGDIMIEQPSGWIRNVTLNQSVEGVMKLAGGEQAPVPGGLEVPVTMTSTLTVVTPEE